MKVKELLENDGWDNDVSTIPEREKLKTTLNMLQHKQSILHDKFHQSLNAAYRDGSAVVDYGIGTVLGKVKDKPNDYNVYVMEYPENSYRGQKEQKKIIFYVKKDRPKVDLMIRDYTRRQNKALPEIYNITARIKEIESQS